MEEDRDEHPKALEAENSECLEAIKEQEMSKKQRKKMIKK